MKIIVLFVKNTPPPPALPTTADHSRPADRLGKSDNTSKLYQFKRALDAVRGGCMSCIEASVVAGMVAIGVGLVGFVVVEGTFSLRRRIHTRTHASTTTLRN